MAKESCHLCGFIHGILLALPVMTEAVANPDFQQIRDALEIPREFAPEVLAEAEQAALRTPATSQFSDLQNIPFVTIDPPTSRDLDQAYFAARRGNGYVVKYAIANVGFFVARGSALEKSAWERGTTIYSPDLKTPLYPPVLSENAASLLPDVTRPAIVFDLHLDARGELESLAIEPAIIRNRAKLAYPDVGEHLDAERNVSGSGKLSGNEWSEALSLLEEIGRKRQQLEIERGAISLRIPAQQVERWSTALYGYRLAFEQSSEVEDWNAQISLMTGMAAASLMIEHEVGLLRSLDPPRSDRLIMLQLTAKAIGVVWPEEWSYADFVRSLDPKVPLHAVMLQQAAKINGGARYMAFAGDLPRHSLHAAIAAMYSHVTAPLRRLADRYVLDLLVDLCAGKSIDAAHIEMLHALPQVMNDAERKSRQLESAIVDFAEVRLLEDRIGERFHAIVTGLRAEGAIVQITDPPIRTLLLAAILAPAAPPVLAADGATLTIGPQTIKLGESLLLQLTGASLVNRTLAFTVI